MRWDPDPQGGWEGLGSIFSVGGGASSLVSEPHSYLRSPWGRRGCPGWGEKFLWGRGAVRLPHLGLRRLTLVSVRSRGSLGYLCEGQGMVRPPGASKDLNDAPWQLAAAGNDGGRSR